MQQLSFMEELTDATIADERLKHGNKLLEKHGRTDLKIVAVNREYDNSFICKDEQGRVYSYLITPNKVEFFSTPIKNYGPNYIVVDPEYKKFESVQLTNKKKEYTTCARYELDKWIQDGWFTEVRK